MNERRRTEALSAADQEALDRSKRQIQQPVEAVVRQMTDGLPGSFLDQIGTIEKRQKASSMDARAQAHAAATLQPTVDADVPAIVRLMNRAYRGTGTGSGWNSEADDMSGDRTSEALLRADIAAHPNAALLVWRTPADVQGCVWLQPLVDGTWYVGSLTIDPRLQNAGLGRQLLAAAERWVRERGGQAMRMTVVNARDTLIAWYVRRGYQPTGETEPFPYDDTRFGVPKRHDLVFIVLQKRLG